MPVHLVQQVQNPTIVHDLMIDKQIGLWLSCLSHCLPVTFHDLKEQGGILCNRNSNVTLSRVTIVIWLFDICVHMGAIRDGLWVPQSLSHEVFQ